MVKHSKTLKNGDGKSGDDGDRSTSTNHTAGPPTATPAPTSSTHHPKKWKGYIKCDDLVPPLCDDTLTVTHGKVETLPGVFVAYWRYTPQNLEPDNQDDNQDKTKKKHPIVVINGGPGLPHNYIKPSRSLACDGREMVLYDQAGTGHSWIEGLHDDLEDVDPDAVIARYPELLTLQYYAHVELPAIIDAMGWTTYHILGESWGTQVAFEYAANSHPSRPPAGLRSLLMNAPIADNHKFIAYQWDPIDGTVGTLPLYTQQRLQYFNETQDFDNPEFEALEDVVMGEFNARIGMQVDCWLATERAGISTIKYDMLTGITDIFFPSPNANTWHWTVLPLLGKLYDHNVPVQLNHGRYDMVRPHLIADTAAALGYIKPPHQHARNDSSIRNLVECHMLEKAAHSILLDSAQEAYQYIQDFVTRVEDQDEQGGGFRAVGSCPTLAQFANRSSSSSSSSSSPSSSSSSSSLSSSGCSDEHWRSSYSGDRNRDKYDQDYYSSTTMTTTTSVVIWVTTIVVAVALSFALGMRWGMRRKRVDGGYETIPNASILE